MLPKPLESLARRWPPPNIYGVAGRLVHADIRAADCLVRQISFPDEDGAVPAYIIRFGEYDRRCCELLFERLRGVILATHMQPIMEWIGDAELLLLEMSNDLGAEL